MGTGAPGPSWARAPERVEEECAPAAGSAMTHREETNQLFFNDLCSDPRAESVLTRQAWLFVFLNKALSWVSCREQKISAYQWKRKESNYL